MVVAAFPIAKLAYLLVRQIGKPFAVRIKERAKTSLFFRTYVCMPPAQFYHWIDVNIKMRMLNLGKPVEVPKLNENMAIELGAELLGEGIVFAVAAACLVAEYRRSSNKEREKEDAREARTEDIVRKLTELQLKVEEQDAKIRELNRVTYGVHTSVAEWWKKRKGESDDEGEATVASLQVVEKQTRSDQREDIIQRALEEADRVVKGKRG